MGKKTEMQAKAFAERVELGRLEKGIRAYMHEQKVLLRLIRRNNGRLHQDEFDRIFNNARPKVRFLISEDEAFILGTFTQAFSDWSRWLHLLQIMIVLGMVKTNEDRKGKVTYILQKKGHERIHKS